MEIKIPKTPNTEVNDIVLSGFKNFHILMKDVIPKQTLKIPQTTELNIKQYRENDKDLDNILNRIKDIKSYKERSREKIISKNIKKCHENFYLDDYHVLIKKFYKIAEKPRKEKLSNIIYESDYSDDSLDYGLFNIQQDHNHDDEILKNLRKHVGKQFKHKDEKLKLILKKDIEGILRVLDDLNIE